jgi:hypothetical protein
MLGRRDNRRRRWKRGVQRPTDDGRSGAGEATVAAAKMESHRTASSVAAVRIAVEVNAAADVTGEKNRNLRTTNELKE